MGPYLHGVLPVIIKDDLNVYIAAQFKTFDQLQNYFTQGQCISQLTNELAHNIL